jgi:hypothetical protein
MTRRITRILGAAATLVFTLVAALTVVSLLGPDRSGPSAPDLACAQSALPDDGSGDRALALADRTYEAFAAVIQAVSDGATADLWRSVFDACGRPAAFDPDGSGAPS